jgi:glycosyltransferase involved in cell wall biosynthesis
VLKLKIQPKFVHIVNNGIDVDHFVPLTSQERKALKEKFKIEPDDYVISELARLTYGKGQDLLIRAIHTVQKKHSELRIKVIFAGTGEQEWFQRKVMDFAAENGIRAEYLGFQSPRDVFGISDLYVLPTLYEGFALTCIEAMIMECPIVRTDTPGWSDMADFCAICEKNNIDDLTEKLEYAVTNKEEMKTRALRGKIFSQTMFTQKHMTEETLAVYKEIIK